MHRFYRPIIFAVLFTMICLPVAAHADPFEFGGLREGLSVSQANNVEISPTPANPGTDLRNAHKFMGYGTLVMGALAAVSSSSHSAHRATSYAAIALGGATVATGFTEYKGYIDLSDGFSRYDIHAVLGTAGLVAFTAAVLMAEADQSHSGFGVASAVSMGLSVVAIKW